MNFTLISHNLRSIVKVVDNVISPDELLIEITKVQNAKEKFPSEEFVEGQLEYFNGNISTITNSMTKTTDSIKNAGNEENKKIVDNIIDEVLNVGTDLKAIDDFIFSVKTPFDDVYVKYVELTDDDSGNECFIKEFNNVKDDPNCKKILAFADSLSKVDDNADHFSTYGLNEVNSLSENALLALKTISGSTTRRSLEEEKTTKDVQDAVDGIIDNVIGNV